MTEPLDGLGTLKQMHALQLDVRVWVVSMTTDGGVVKKAMSKGARGYISKYSGFDTLIAATRTVHTGKTHFSADIAEALSAEQGAA